ncbi:MAG: HEAT repeat domain-containing protein [Pirellulaceae bacterium]|nr:HEAT repeat domain-containing protein [Pirellulaceae bacterium]
MNPNHLFRHPFSTSAVARRTHVGNACFIGLVIACLLPGCDTSPPSSRAENSKGAAKKTAGNSASTKPKPKPAPQVAPDAFANLDAAVESLKSAAKASDTEAFVLAEQWIVLQGDAGVAPLGQILNDQGADLEHRIAVCRTLRRLGPKAKAPFQQALGDKSPQIQLNAIKGLGLIEPTDPEIIKTLQGYLEHKEPRFRTEALFALANVGPPAQKAVEKKLISMLNDVNENETVRGAAKKALEEVAPRRTFVDP